MQDARILKTFHKCLAGGGYKCVIIVTKRENYTPINILLDYKILRQSINLRGNKATLRSDAKL